MLNFDDCKLLYKRIQIGSNVHWLTNYGKTWALTKGELEKKHDNKKTNKL